MLAEITIENIAVIEHATAIFSCGFTVLTGETGAGKSILIDSINAIMGNRASRDLVRDGADKARIWARFSEYNTQTASLLQNGGYGDEDELLLTREISAEGKSNCRVNNAPATASLLRQLCGDLIEIHGQHDNQSLLNAANHLTLLDTYARNVALRAEYKAVYDQWRAGKKEMEQLSVSTAEKTRKLDLLQFEVDEIDKAALLPGEEDVLKERRNIIRNAQSILDSLQNAYQALSGTDESEGASVLLAQAAREVEDAVEYDADLQYFSTGLNDLYYSTAEMATELQTRIDAFQFNPGQLDEIEQRLDLIYRLRQKYGNSVEQVIDYGERARQEIQRINFSDERLSELEAQRTSLEKALSRLASRLAQSREKAFKQLSKSMQGALEFLNMPGIKLETQRREIPFSPTGTDSIEFLISTNPGEPPKPLARIASGGELARIMLALKGTLADQGDLSTVIYDEIDTGISGLAAGRIGQMLRDTAQDGRQVICVTHTAQVAAYADKHLLIEKRVEKGRTYTEIRELNREQRVQELARIVAGENITDIALKSAEEMLLHAKSTQKV